MRYTDREIYLIWLDSFEGLEYKHKKSLPIYNGGSLLSHIKRNSDYIVRELGENVYNTLCGAATASYTQYVLDGLSKNNAEVITAESENYPEDFEGLEIPPLVLYYRGDIKLLSTRKFAIVGSRRSIPLSIAKAEEFTAALASAGFTPVTGMAEGVDSTVLKTAMRHGGVISVLAGGFGCIYPKSNIGLFNQVAEKGLAISEYPPSVPCRPYHFPVRNRIIAALGTGTLVVSAGLKSGTTYTAEYADALSKQVFALPYSVNVPSGAGCNNLIKMGAYLTETPQDILDFYNIEPPTRQAVQLTPNERVLYELIKQESMHIEQLCVKTGKKAFELTPVLAMLEIKKLIIKTVGNVYSRIG